MDKYKLSYTAKEIDEILGKIADLDTTLTQSGKVADAKAVGDVIIQLSEEIAKKGNGMSGNVATLLITILRGAVYDTDQSANIEALKTALEAGELPDTPDTPDTPTGNIIPLTVVKGSISRVDGQKITYDTTTASATERACTNPIALYIESGKTYKIKLSNYSTYSISLQAMTYSVKDTNFAVTEGTQRIIYGDFTRTYSTGWKQEDIEYVADGTADIIIILFAKGNAKDELFTTEDYAALNSMLTVTVK